MLKNYAMERLKQGEVVAMFQKRGLPIPLFIQGKKPIGYIDLYYTKRGGRTKNLEPANINDFLQHHSASFGITRSGKSNGAGRLMEELMLKGIKICVVDYKGEFTTLGTLSGVHAKVVNISEADVNIVVEEFVAGNQSYVLNLETITDDVYLNWLLKFFTRLWELRRQEKMAADSNGGYIVPTKIFVDECQYFVPRISPKAMPKELAEVARNLKGIFRNISQQGVGLGLPLHLITQRPTYLDPFIRNQCDMLLLYRQKWANDIEVYLSIIPNDGTHDKDQVAKSIEEMKTGWATYVGRDGRVFDAWIKPKRAIDLSKTPGWEQHIKQLEVVKHGWQEDGFDSTGIAQE
jgi:hypothetical protein